MKFQIRDKIYDVATTDRITIAMALELQTETAALGHQITMGDIEDMTKRVAALPAAEQKNAMDTMWLTAITVWAAQRVAGVPIKFSEAIDLPMADLTVIPDPQDHRSPDPTKARPRKGSGQAAKPRPAAAVRT